MKNKLLSLAFIFMVILLTGCTKVAVGDYKEGTYFAYDEATNYTAVVYIDESGIIKSVFIDAAYIQYDADNQCPEIIVRGNVRCNPSTKQTLGEDYGMRDRSAQIGIIEGGAEWYEQIDDFTNKVIEEQGIEWINFKYKNPDGTVTSVKPDDKTEDDKVYTDSVAGVTIIVDNLYRLINDILEQAKK